MAKGLNTPSESVGTFALPDSFLDINRPEYEFVRRLFDKLKWTQSKPRKDFLDHRFNAFCAILEAIRDDPDNIFWTYLNKAQYDLGQFYIPYRAMKDVVNALVDLGWIKRHGERKYHRSYRYLAPRKSPLVKLEIGSLKLTKVKSYKPIVEIRRGQTNLEKAPVDIELMNDPWWKAWIRKHLIPPMEKLNDKLDEHEFIFFPFGKRGEDTYPQYRRIYTNTSEFKEGPALRNGRIYARNFNLPSKKKGWRQMTLIDGQPTVEVDVHASSLTLLSADYYVGFELPETDDYYQYGPLSELNRKLVKTIIQALMNGVVHDRTTWPESFKEDYPELIKGVNWREYVEPIVSLYPALAKIKPDMGGRLMLDEATIIIHAMNTLLDKGIGCLSVHDCLIVPKVNTEDAKKAFYSAYAHFHRKRPLLSVE